MGQRLNLEIINNDDVLANAYYHWSGYTRSSLELTKMALGYLVENTEGDELVRAIRALEATGAGLTDVEKKILEKKNLDSLNFAQAIDRSEGLISISPDGIEETQTWSEGTVIINIEDLKVDFQALSFYGNEEQYIEHCEPEEDEEILTLPEDINLESINPDQIDRFENFLEETIKNGLYSFKTTNGTYFSIIE